MKQNKTQPVLVLLHAFPLSSAMWEAQRTALEIRYRLVTPDLPGFGKNRSIQAGSIAAMARWVAKDLLKQGVQQPVMIAGLSMGGYVALEFARLYPGRVSALGLWATRATADTLEQRQKRFEQIRLVRKQGMRPLAKAMIPKLLGSTTLGARPNVLRAVKRHLALAPATGVAQALRVMARRRDHTTYLSKIKVPVLIVAGREDAIIPLEETRRMHRALRKSTLCILPRAGHLLNFEIPALFNQALQKFLRRIY